MSPGAWVGILQARDEAPLADVRGGSAWRRHHVKHVLREPRGRDTPVARVP